MAEDINQEIVSRMMARDEAGLRLLYRHYSDALYGIAFRVLRHNKAHAEDALQKSFLKIWNSINQFDDEKSTLFTWMSRITRNTAIDISRLKTFQAEQKSETVDPNVHNTEVTTIKTETLDSTALLEGLDDKYSFVLEHLYLKGYTQKELSDEFGIPLGTIKTRVKKAIDILRSRLKNEKKTFLGLFILITTLILIFIR